MSTAQLAHNIANCSTSLHGCLAATGSRSSSGDDGNKVGTEMAGWAGTTANAFVTTMIRHMPTTCAVQAINTSSQLDMVRTSTDLYALAGSVERMT